MGIRQTPKTLSPLFICCLVISGALIRGRGTPGVVVGRTLLKTSEIEFIRIVAKWHRPVVRQTSRRLTVHRYPGTTATIVWITHQNGCDGSGYDAVVNASDANVQAQQILSGLSKTSRSGSDSNSLISFQRREEISGVFHPCSEKTRIPVPVLWEGIRAQGEFSFVQSEVLRTGPPR